VPLCDIVTPRPRVLFVGINPSLRSAAVGHHFASPGNPFWRLLHAALLVPVELTAEQDGRLAEFGLALTNLCPRATRAASELGRDEIERGKRRLRAKIRRLRPEVVAFVGITIYRDFFRDFSSDSGPAALRRAGAVARGGAGAAPETISGARVFVLPNPSGLNASFPGFRDKLVWFERLRRFIDSAPTDEPRAAEHRAPQAGACEDGAKAPTVERAG
jgi:TDG/mug DNA glycosylase family protein